MADYYEKRQYERYDYTTSVHLYRYENPEQYTPAVLGNYSSGGLYLETDNELEVGQQVYVKIENHDPAAGNFETYDQYTGYVRWSSELGTSQPGGQYGYGIEYDNPMTD